MTNATAPVCGRHEPELAGQTVGVIGGSAGIGLGDSTELRLLAAYGV